MNSQFSVRIATASDWQKIQELLATVPMNSDLKLVTTRHGGMHEATPDFFNNSMYFLAQDGETILGSLHLSIRSIIVNNKTLNAGYVGEMRIRQSHQGLGIGRVLSTKMFEWCRKHGISTIYCLVNDGNLALMTMFKKLPDVAVKVLRSFETNSYIVSKWFRQSAPEFIPTDTSKENLEKLLLKLKKNSYFFNITATDFFNFVQEQPGLVFFARRSTPQDLAFALWNQNSFRRLSLVETGKKFQALRLTMNILSQLARLEKIPPAGSSWRQMETCFVSPEISSAELIESALSYASQNKLHFLNALGDIKRGRQKNALFSVKTKSHFVVISLNKDQPFPESEDLPYVDLGFV